MKQCISRIIKYLIHLWQTLKEYVCKRTTKLPKISITDEYFQCDIDRDGESDIDILLDSNHENYSDIEKEE